MWAFVVCSLVMCDTEEDVAKGGCSMHTDNECVNTRLVHTVCSKYLHSLPGNVCVHDNPLKNSHKYWTHCEHTSQMSSLAYLLLIALENKSTLGNLSCRHLIYFSPDIEEFYVNRIWGDISFSQMMLVHLHMLADASALASSWCSYIKTFICQENDTVGLCLMGGKLINVALCRGDEWKC